MIAGAVSWSCQVFQKRRQLAEACAKFCAAPAHSGKVVPIRAAAT
jgi:hypothetical protein